MHRIGLISDTHGLLRPEAVQFLRGCDHIIHAGDIGNGALLDALNDIAPVTAVRGNNDQGEWASKVPETQTLRVGGIAFFVLHDAEELPRLRELSDVQVVVCGHSHKPEITRKAEGLLLINPGSAGPRRFKLPVSAAEVAVANDGFFVPRLVNLVEAG